NARLSPTAFLLHCCTRRNHFGPVRSLSHPYPYHIILHTLQHQYSNLLHVTVIPLTLTLHYSNLLHITPIPILTTTTTHLSNLLAQPPRLHSLHRPSIHKSPGACFYHLHQQYIHSIPTPTSAPPRPAAHHQRVRHA